MTALTNIFSNGVLGMMAFSNAMGAVSDNIANISTPGYKRADTLFTTLMNKGIGVADSSTGVISSTRQLVNVQGEIQMTGQAADLAINGGGLFIFGNSTRGQSTEFYYSRDGALTTVVDGTTAYLANRNGQILLAAPVPQGGAGTLAPPENASQLVPVKIGDQALFPGQATAAAALSAVIPAAGATSISSPIYYYDASGVRQNLTVTWSNPLVVAGTSTTWDVTVTDAGGVSVGGSPLAAMTFDNTGKPTTTTLSIPASGAQLNLDVSGVVMLGQAKTGPAGTALATGIDYVQDGLPAGAFESFEIQADGTIIGHYGGGATRALYRLPLASFASPNNLSLLSGNIYQPNEKSGSATFRFPGDDWAHLEIGARETSNVDLGDSFGQMIITQRAYSAAATVVRTADEMSGTARDLLR